MIGAILPILLIRNEEWIIGPVLEAATAAFGWALVGDTGSTDATLEIARAVHWARVVALGNLSPRDLGQARGLLARIGREMGATWGLQIDGDELYDIEQLKEIARIPIPGGKRAGFTKLVTIDYDEATGEFWELNDVFSRLALFPLSDRWIGEYPFEYPESFDDRDAHFYYTIADGAVHGIHLHRLRRSPRDSDVYLREQKRFQFAMQEKPQVTRVRPLRAPFAAILRERYALTFRCG